MGHDELELRPISGTLGAEVTGADLRRVDDSMFEQIHSALLEHEVLFFRDSKLSDEQHIDLAERWGEISVFPLNRVLGSTEPSFQVIQDGPDSPPAADQWHTDVTWTPEPPKVALLRATLVPERGGDTMWGSMTAAYDALSAPVKTLLEGLVVHHDSTDFVESVVRKIGDEQAKALDDALGDAPLDCVVYIKVGEAELVRRLSGRVSCRKCGTPFQRDALDSSVQCPVCGGELYQRADDQPDVVRTRIRVQWPGLTQLTDYYSQQDKLVEVDGEQGVDQVSEAALEAISRYAPIS